MAPKVKEAMGWASEAIETAAGWAIVAVALYGLLFVDMTGNGRLWDAMRGVAKDSFAAQPAPRGDVAVEVRRVPVRPPDLAVKAQNHMLLVPEVPDHEIDVPVVASNQSPAPADRMTDAPADAHAGKDWRVHIKGQMRTFTVYGRGEERSSASASVTDAPAAAADSAPTPSVAASAYRAGAGAIARPGIASRVTPVSDGAADGVRNFRGR